MRGPVHLGTILLIAILYERLENRPAARCAHGVGSKRIEVDALLHDRCNLGRCHDCCEGEAIANALQDHYFVCVQCKGQGLMPGRFTNGGERGREDGVYDSRNTDEENYDDDDDDEGDSSETNCDNDDDDK
jgi:hypothetical protein